MAEARAAGFEHVNLDLIYGTPRETDADWQASLDAAIGAGPDHISAYALVVEEGTALARQVAPGVVPAPDDDVLADRYVQADETLRRGRLRLVRGLELGPTPSRPLPAQRALLERRQLVGRRPGRAQPRRRRALVERQAPGPLRRDWSTPAAARRPAARRSTPRPGCTERIMLGVRLRDGSGAATTAAPARVEVPQLVALGAGRARGRCASGRVVLTQRGRLMADAVVRELLDGADRLADLSRAAPGDRGAARRGRAPARAGWCAAAAPPAAPGAGRPRGRSRRATARRAGTGRRRRSSPRRAACPAPARAWWWSSSSRRTVRGGDVGPVAGREPWSGYGRPSRTALKITQLHLASRPADSDDPYASTARAALTRPDRRRPSKTGPQCGRRGGRRSDASRTASSRCCARSSRTSSPPTSRSAARRWPTGTTSASRRRRSATTWPRWRTRA